MTETEVKISKMKKVCETCRGTGYTITYDDPGAKDCSLGGGWMEFVDPCPDCLDSGFCPLCGTYNIDWIHEGEAYVCPVCGYNDRWFDESPDTLHDILDELGIEQIERW